MIVEFIVGVYVPTWFMIKVKHNLTEGPRHLLSQLKQLKTQCKAVVDEVMPTAKHSAWYALFESIQYYGQCYVNSMKLNEEKGFQRNSKLDVLRVINVS